MGDHAAFIMHAGTPRQNLRQQAGWPCVTTLATLAARTRWAGIALDAHARRTSFAGCPTFALRAALAALTGRARRTRGPGRAGLTRRARRATFTLRAWRSRRERRHKRFALTHQVLECELALSFPLIHIGKFGLEAQIPF